MSDDPLPTRLWLDAHLRQLTASGMSFTIIRKGDAARGTVALKLLLGRREGCRILTQARDPEGELGWMVGFEGRNVSEDEADAYLERMASRDPDLWIIEIESKDGHHPFGGKVF